MSFTSSTSLPIAGDTVHLAGSDDFDNHLDFVQEFECKTFCMRAGCSSSTSFQNISILSKHCEPQFRVISAFQLQILNERIGWPLHHISKHHNSFQAL
jgi:hypothetical protein